MKKLFPIFVLLAACAADLPQDPAPAESITVQFDPGAATPVVPLPNDLAKDPTTGKIKVPPSPTDTPAQKEFNEQYLGTLDGFPYESNASVLVTGDLDPASVKPGSVLAFDITAAPTPVVIAPTYADKKITIPPPAGLWLRGHKYALAVLGGKHPSALKGAAGQEVLGSQTWALVSSRNPLVTCPENLSAPDCEPAVDIIPSNETDPEAKLKDETRKALQLETLRRGYAPILDALAAPPVSAQRADIALVWTFSIVDAGEMTFDPANKVIPFPNDAVRTGPKGTVQLPHPKTGMPLTAADCQTTDSAILLICGLNTLDGFSTLAPLISENSDKEGAIAQGTTEGNTIDAKTLSPATVGLAKLASTAPMEIQTAPKWTPCLNCQSSADANGMPVTTPQQLQWKLDVPLDEKTTYFGYVSNGVKDAKGKGVVANPVFALARSAAPLVDDAGKSTVSLITDAQAKQLEPLRAAFKPAFDALESKGVHRTDLALGFGFTTQSESTILDLLYTAPTQAKALGLPDFPLRVQDATTLYQGAAGAASIPVTNISKFFAGVWLTPVAVTGPGGTLNPDASAWKVLPVQFAMSIPTGTAPAGGWPVTIFGHGFTRSRNDFLAIANSLAAAGQAVIATDVLYHGERTSCTGAKAATSQTDDASACADPATMKCDEGFVGLCVLRDDTARASCTSSTSDPLGDGVCATAGQGRCAADKKCQGVGASLARDAGGRPLVSGWNIFSLTNFFATRDNFRQQVIDLSQLVNVLKSTDAKKIGNQIALANGGTPIALDPSKLGYVGQSLGGILGTLFNSVSPDTTNVVLNVPGGALVSIILNAPSFAAQKKALIDTLAAAGRVPGTPAFDQFLGIAQWVLDEADPANMAYRLTHPVTLASGVKAPNVNRKAFIQFIEGDETVPNISNFALVVGANREFTPTPPNLNCKAPLFCYEFTEAVDGFDKTSAPTNKRHGFLLSPPSATAGGLAITTKAQTQAATFLATGALQ